MFKPHKCLLAFWSQVGDGGRANVKRRVRSLRRMRCGESRWPTAKSMMLAAANPRPAAPAMSHPTSMSNVGAPTNRIAD